MLCDRLHAWWLTQSRLTTLLPFLIARRWVGPQNNDGSGLKTFNQVDWDSMLCLRSEPLGFCTVGFLLIQLFSVCLAVQQSSCFISLFLILFLLF